MPFPFLFYYYTVYINPDLAHLVVSIVFFLLHPIRVTAFAAPGFAGANLRIFVTSINCFLCSNVSGAKSANIWIFWNLSGRDFSVLWHLVIDV
ncbi:hypothetical protein GDO86_001299 [Hymenochirus boettgeri]|uniref:Uncharacterized protein n=1 Tax=Hymenochirus boettgeri TaxID=247094 RepID=A0A8T2KC39_9PIPI|nr:hypothetical protein GDO86_001299 [Hymenochirus boettgeri]